MQRYLFEYKILPTGETSEFSHVAASEEEARQSIKERVADLEFVEPEEVEIGTLLRTLDASKRYYECEGCT
ncbi:hypothetical protein [Terribacillus saccharophilus]|uniref:hypothetical protein n=1 Tax=Terribacillus saccharophilus TaxID=361277 RepID=UPI003982CD9B